MSVNPLKKVLRSGEGKKLKALEALVPDISELESDMKALADADLQALRRLGIHCLGNFSILIPWVGYVECFPIFLHMIR